MQSRRSHVDGHAAEIEPASVPLRHLPQRVVDDPAAYLGRQIGIVEHLLEVAGGERPAQRVVPAQQRLEADRM
jgi:hypothetical protein